MADSLFGSLLSTLDKRSISGVTAVLGESEASVSRGMGSALIVVLAGLASKSHDSAMLEKLFSLAPGGSEKVTWSHVAAAVTNPGSTLISGGKYVLSTLFGSDEAMVGYAVCKDSGLRSGATIVLMAMAAPIVMNFLARQVRSQAMSMSSLGSVLQRESTAIRSALPAGLNDLLGHPSSDTAASPVIAQTIEKKRPPSAWLVAFGVIALALGTFWLFHHLRRTSAQITSVTAGTANRTASDVSGLGNVVKSTLPGGLDLDLPENGVEMRLLAFIQDPNTTPDQATWFDFDRLQFDMGSAILRPESNEQLSNIAAILTAYPEVCLKVGGYTDDVGDTADNLKLSRERARAVVAELIRKGISPARLAGRGYGEQHNIAENSTEEGRAKNRRVSLRVVRK